jgi:hypothetical protein
MKNALIFVAGFGAGWLTRSTFHSSKSATVQVLAFALDTVARFKRALAIEKEQLEDIMAEAHDAVVRRRAEHVREEQTDSAPADQAA